MQQPADISKCTVYKFDDITDVTAGTNKVLNLCRKTTGELNAITLDTLQFMPTRFSPFDNYIHVIEGKVETIIDGNSLHINTGEFLIIPGHSRNTSQALQPTKLLQLIIKSGYEQML